MNQTWIKWLPEFLRRHLEDRLILQKIIANSGWLFADKMLRIGIGLLVNAWLARYLGPSQFGLFNYALAFIAIFSSLAGLGLDGIAVRDIVRNPACRDETLGTVFVLKLVSGAVTMCIAVTLVSLLRPGDSLIHWLVGINAISVIFQALDPIDLWFQSLFRSKFVVYARNSAFLLLSAVKILLIYLNMPLTAFAWAGVAEVALGSIGLVIVYRYNGYCLTLWRSSWKRAKQLLSDSWPLVLSGLAVYIHARIDQVLLGQMIGNAEVGQYSAAMSLIETFGFIPVAIVTSTAPEIARVRAANQVEYFGRLLNLYRLMVILFLITAIPIYLFADWAVVLFYGREYAAAGVLLSLFAVRLFFTNMGTVKSLYLTNENLFRYSLLTAIIGSCANICFNYLLIPRYKAVGAIWAMILSYFIATFMIDVFFTEVRKNLKLMLLAVLTPWKIKAS